uniref:Mediator of RNA polymerase II transcription subunit 9 n=1 Tax=Octactis speculum TaxID=3111310 RepID=A0A7S2ATN2_9STRA|mmetsp:Transcript_15235/g.20426  ORF Transcript_15235/g.20426 Transcript_15235/m.20426 type:complete len:104 (+) Transcript_15235:136-447(+)
MPSSESTDDRERQIDEAFDFLSTISDVIQSVVNDNDKNAVQHASRNLKRKFEDAIQFLKTLPEIESSTEEIKLELASSQDQLQTIKFAKRKFSIPDENVHGES